MSLKQAKFTVLLAVAFDLDGLIAMRDATNPDAAALCTATGEPFCVVVDSGDAAETSHANMLGLSDTEQWGVAAEALDYDDRLFPIDGKLQKLPAAAGTYWCCGKASGTASGDEDPVKFIPCHPYPVTVA